MPCVCGLLCILSLESGDIINPFWSDKNNTQDGNNRRTTSNVMWYIEDNCNAACILYNGSMLFPSNE